MTAIVATNLTKRYGKKRGIEGVNLEVRPGEVLGFLGPNGAGKTTTIRLLLNFIRPTGGSASILGYDCRRESLKIRRRIGYVPGEFSLYESLTGEQFLRFIANLRGGVEQNRIDELAERLDCDLRRPLRELSRGNKQKVCILQAMMSRPDVLLLDEPTTGLDPLMQQAFYELLDDFQTGGQTIFFSSHVLSEVERVCQRVAMIHDGRIIKVADVSELKTASIRRLTAALAGPASAGLVEGLPGVRDVSVEKNQLSCVVQGSIDGVLKRLASVEVLDLICREPSLEEVFLAFYGRGTDVA